MGTQADPSPQTTTWEAPGMARAQQGGNLMASWGKQ